MLPRPLLAALALSMTLAACSRDDTVDSDAERFCGEAIDRREWIVDPPLDSESGLEATLEFYVLMGQLAPIAIAEEWNQLVVNIETASTLVPGDTESEQLVAMTAYSTEPAAFAVKEWLAANCGVDIPITTIAPQERAPARVTTTTAVDEEDSDSDSDSDDS